MSSLENTQGFGLNLYNFVVQIIGDVPDEMHFLYAIGTIALIVTLFMIVYVPFTYLLGRR